MRLGVDDDHLTFLDAGRAAEDAGAAAVALHARTAQQLYSGTADWSAITELKEAVTSIPVLGNGDIWDAADAIAMMRTTGCDGVVVGRGCLGRPWLFRDLAAAFAGDDVEPPPNLGRITDAMRRHAALLAEWFGETHGLKEFRKHTGWYLQGFVIGSTLRRDLRTVATLDELDHLLAPLDGATPFPLDALRMPRGHTHGPKPVTVPEGWFDHPDVTERLDRDADLVVSGG
jgi:nifR3 family TIM-barrel protein